MGVPPFMETPLSWIRMFSYRGGDSLWKSAPWRITQQYFDDFSSSMPIWFGDFLLIKTWHFFQSAHIIFSPFFDHFPLILTLKPPYARVLPSFSCDFPRVILNIFQATASGATQLGGGAQSRGDALGPNRRQGRWHEERGMVFREK